MALYGEFLYGDAFYGNVLPTSATWDICDFCEPTDATMLTLFSYTEVESTRPYGPPYFEFDVNNDLVMYSDDGLPTGFSTSLSIPNTFSIQFGILPTTLPADFSDPATNRVFVAGYNRLGKMVGILLSENGGVALTVDGLTVSQVLPDSADIFDSGSSYYVFRITCDEDTGRGNLYITRSDLIDLIGHQLRYTFSLLDSPGSEADHAYIDIIGTAVDPVQISLDCWRLSSQLVIPNQRPVAIPGPDQTLVLGSYAGFDGRDSYDPDGTVTKWWWTVTEAPDNSNVILTGSSTTPVDASGYTNRLEGASGDFVDFRIGDLLYVGTSGSVIKYVGDDYVVAIDSVYPAGTTVTWRLLHQSGWGGSFVSGDVTVVLDAQTAPPPLPEDGDTYLVTSPATGLWVGQEDKLATWVDATSTWTFATPVLNDPIYVVADYSSRRYIGYAYPAGQWEVMDPKPWELDHWTGRVDSIASYLPDVDSLFTMSLVVADAGGLDSLPAEVLLNVNQTSIPFGVIPDLGWIWNYLPDFWNLLPDREKITTIWSGFAQVAAGLLLELWQHDYAKAVIDIQRVFQKRWLHYASTVEESNWDELPADINTEVDLAGYSATPGTNLYSYNTGTALTGVTSDHLLILDGVGYRIARTAGTAVVTSDPLPTVLPNAWKIGAVITSDFTNFDDVRVQFGDAAIFDVTDGVGNSFDVESFIYGVRANKLCFDADSISTYSDYTVKFKSVRRRSAYNVYEYIVGVPRLQEVINRTAVSGSAEPLYQNLNFTISSEEVWDHDVNTLRFLDAWFPAVANGYDGDTTAGPQYIDSASVDFEDVFGVDADLSGYVVDLATGRYRLKRVVSASRIELDSDVSAAATGLEWTVRRVDDPPDYMWAEITYVDNRPTIEANFGRLVDFKVEDLETRSSDLDYLSAVQGLWYTYWFGATHHNLRIGVQILLGLPFAEVKGTITDIQSPFDLTRSRVLIQDAANDSIIRSYFFPTDVGIETNPSTGVAYTRGDVVEQFAPLSGGAAVRDWVSDPEWLQTMIGSGDAFEVWKTHTFGVVVSADAFSIENLRLVISYILKIKPTYTYPFFTVTKAVHEDIDVDDDTVFGPAIPSVGYPESWPPMPIPVGWSSSPNEMTRTTTPVFDPSQRWPTGRFVGPPCCENYGGLHLYDVPGKAPDGWSGAWPNGAAGTHAATISEGSFRYDDHDESGHTIHRFDGNLSPLLTNVATDGDMEAVGVASWPDIPGSGPTTKQKSVTYHHGGAQSLEVSDVQASRGFYQDFPATVDVGFQVAVRCYVYIVSGSVTFRLRDQDGSTYVATARAQTDLSQWQEVTLHHWAVGSGASAVRFEVMTGAAGAHFYIDDVVMSSKNTPWSQWGFDVCWGGRTGNYTRGSLPDEFWQFQISMPVT